MGEGSGETFYVQVKKLRIPQSNTRSTKFAAPDCMVILWLGTRLLLAAK